MNYFSLILFKIIPLYANILLGYMAGKILGTSRDSIARLLFFMITPLIIFNGVVNTKLDTSILLLPLIVFIISSGLCLLFYRISNRLWQDTSRNLMAFSAGSGNTGYFGLPVALLLFNEQGEGIYIMALLGMTLYENSVGFYIFSKGTNSGIECLWKMIKLPALYAFAAGLIFNFAQVPSSSLFAEFMTYIKCTYTVLGMMIIGLGLSTLHSFKLDFKFIGMTFGAKFLAWPLIILAMKGIDILFFHFFSNAIYDALMLIAIVPLGVNMVILASLFNCHPEKASSAVVMSIVLALVYVPIMTNYFIEVAPPTEIALSKTPVEQSLVTYENSFP
jgi:malate permease and related proteins